MKLTHHDETKKRDPIMSMDNSVSSFFDNQIMNTDSHFCQN